jgi:hypothetical protein
MLTLKTLNSKAWWCAPVIIPGGGGRSEVSLGKVRETRSLSKTKHKENAGGVAQVVEGLRSIHSTTVTTITIKMSNRHTLEHML